MLVKLNVDFGERYQIFLKVFDERSERANKVHAAMKIKRDIARNLVVKKKERNNHTSRNGDITFVYVGISHLGIERSRDESASNADRSGFYSAHNVSRVVCNVSQKAS